MHGKTTQFILLLLLSHFYELSSLAKIHLNERWRETKAASMVTQAFEIEQDIEKGNFAKAFEGLWFGCSQLRYEKAE